MKDALWGNVSPHSRIPHLLLDHLEELKISSEELLVIIHVLRYRNTKRTTSFPKNKTIAKKIGISERMLRRYCASLKEKGYLTRTRIDDTKHEWDFSGLATVIKMLRVGRWGDTHDPPRPDTDDLPWGDTHDPHIKKQYKKENTKDSPSGNGKTENQEQNPVHPLHPPVGVAKPVFDVMRMYGLNEQDAILWVQENADAK
jgi:DNA-binding HxlR family transcriptional regulator|tara:strand:+ start:101 stop:700 length:600 start_codon:yes stop_codon:yes gene_type:complete